MWPKFSYGSFPQYFQIKQRLTLPFKLSFRIRQIWAADRSLLCYCVSSRKEVDLLEVPRLSFWFEKRMNQQVLVTKCLLWSISLLRDLEQPYFVLFIGGHAKHVTAVRCLFVKPRTTLQFTTVTACAQPRTTQAHLPKMGIPGRAPKVLQPPLMLRGMKTEDALVAWISTESPGTKQSRRSGK